VHPRSRTRRLVVGAFDNPGLGLWDLRFFTLFIFRNTGIYHFVCLLSQSRVFIRERRWYWLEETGTLVPILTAKAFTDKKRQPMPQGISHIKSSQIPPNKVDEQTGRSTTKHPSHGAGRQSRTSSGRSCWTVSPARSRPGPCQVEDAKC